MLPVIFVVLVSFVPPVAEVYHPSKSNPLWDETGILVIVWFLPTVNWDTELPPWASNLTVYSIGLNE